MLIREEEVSSFDRANRARRASRFLRSSLCASLGMVSDPSDCCCNGDGRGGGGIDDDDDDDDGDIAIAPDGSL